MIEREILKDIRQYEMKIVGAFTLRNLVCFILTCVTAIPTFFILRHFNIIIDFCLFASMITGGPFLLCGWWKPYGVPFEKFALNYIQTLVMCPSFRKYKTNNYYEELFKGMEMEEGPTKKMSAKEQKHKQAEIKSLGPDYAPIK